LPTSPSPPSYQKVVRETQNPADLPLRAPVSPHRRAESNKSCSFRFIPLIFPLNLRAEEEKWQGKLQSDSVAARIYHLSLSLSKDKGELLELGLLCSR